VLSNDYSSEGSLALNDLLATGEGYFEIRNDSMFFQPADGFSGTTYAGYLTCDSLGECGIGIATIYVLDGSSTPAIDTLHYFTVENVSFSDLLPGENFAVISDPSLGSVQFADDAKVFQYYPVQGQFGEDEFLLSNGEYERLVQVTILQAPQENTFVIDDYFYTPVDESITFNVLNNDLSDQFDIDGYSQITQGTLTNNENTEGEFSYTPPTGFTGFVSFEYTICALNNCETGSVYIFVGDLSPSHYGTYQLVTNKNRPIIINYDVPITNFDFEVDLDPAWGTIEVNDGYDTIALGCEESFGYNLVIYEPLEDYVGEDEFQLKYCPGGGEDCQIVKVKVDILDLNIDSVCICTDDCVWPGDADGDGRVDMLDLLSMGMDIGESGPERPFVEMDQWIGQYCDDWFGYVSSETQNNLKHADTDGDGMVQALDTASISHFYNKVHTLIAERDYFIKDYDISLELQDTIFEIGDLVSAEIVIGTENDPVFDINGIAMSFFFPPAVIDTSTIRGFHYTDSWLTAHSMPLNLVKQSGGSLDMGLTRLGHDPTNGFGGIGKVEFIIDDDIDGFRPGGRYIPVDIKLEKAYIKSSSGSTFRLPSTSKRIYIDLFPEEDDETDDSQPLVKLSVFPNPNPGTFTIESLNNHDIEHVELYSIDGRLVLDRKISSYAKRVEISDQALREGIYILRVQTSKGKVTRKVSIIRP
jgi:hypothetical protein